MKLRNLVRKYGVKVLGVFGAVTMAAQNAHAAWTVDLSGITTDVTTIGGAVLSVAAVILGFRLVKGMVNRS
jgi:hypothetical protein